MLHLHQLLQKAGNSSSSHFSSSTNFDSVEPFSSSSSIILPQTICKRCGIDFDDIRALRDHFKSHHNHGPRESSTTETIDENESGSDEDDDDNDLEENEAEAEPANDDHTVTYLTDSYDNDDDTVSSANPSQPYAYGVRPPFIPVVIRDLGEEYVYSVYRILLTNYLRFLDTQNIYWRHPSYVLHLPSLSPHLISPGECWLVMLYRGGYFSGVIAEMAASGTSNRSTTTTNTTEIKILYHKRFARYTTRRKQGGSQSAHDASTGKAANSMGAQLRRYNEQLLIQEIHTLLQSSEWSSSIKNNVTRIFVSAAKTMVGHLFDGKTLCRGDKRISTIPFATSRPTFEEAIRVVETLSKVRIVGPYTSNEEEEKKLIYATPSVGSTVVSVKRSEKTNEGTGTKNEVENPREDNDEDDDEHGEDDDDTTDQQQQPSTASTNNKKKKKKRNRNKPKPKSKGNAETTLDLPANQPKRKTKPNNDTKANNKDNDDDDDELLNSAIMTATLEANNVQIALEQQILLSNIVQETIREILILSNRLRLPGYILARVLGLRHLESAFTGTNGSTSSSTNSNRASVNTNFNFTLYSGPNVGIQVENAREKLMLMNKLLTEANLSHHDLLLTMGWDSLAAAVVVAETGLQVDWSQVQVPTVESNDNDTTKNSSSATASKGNKSKKNKAKDIQNDEQQQTRLLTLQDHPSVVPLQRNYLPLSPDASSTTAINNRTSSSSSSSSSSAAISATVPLRVNAADEAAINSMDDKERKRMLMRMAAESRALQQQQSSSSSSSSNQ